LPPCWRWSVDGLCELGERHALIAAAQVVKAYEHGVVAAVFDLVLDDHATPVSVALRAFVVLVVQVASAGDEAVMASTGDEPDGVVKRLLVAHRERVADLFQSTCRCAAQRAATHRLNIDMAVADTINEDRLKVAMHREAVLEVVEIVSGDEAVQLRVIVRGPVDSVLMVAERDVQLGPVELVFDFALVIVESLKRCAENVEGVVGCFDVVVVAATLKGSLADVVTAQAWHVGVVAEVHHNVGLALDDVGTDPLQVNSRHSWLGLRVRNDQVRAR
jgi:hypothetical protein